MQFFSLSLTIIPTSWNVTQVYLHLHVFTQQTFVIHMLSARSIVLVNFLIRNITSDCFSAFMGYFRIGVITSVTFFHCILFYIEVYHRGVADFLLLCLSLVSLQAKFFLIKKAAVPN